MSNVTLIASSRPIRPFYWGYPGTNPANPLGQVTTTLATPSIGKLRDSIYTTFQAILYATAASATATVQIQVTNDALTGHGVSVPLLLTNGSANIAIPQGVYTMTVLDGTNNPTGTRQITSNTPTNLYTIPVDMTSAVWPSPFVQFDQKVVAAQVGWLVNVGVAGLLPAGTTIATITAGGQAGTLSNTFTGTTGVYECNLSANFWNTTSLGTITLSTGTGLTASDGFSSTTAWKYARANVTAISGTNATVQVWMGA
jgi:hypothetical protein